jgi:cytochrome bd-type quinol oxidase subunit 1
MRFLTLFSSARVQFAFTVSVHIVFSTISIGPTKFLDVVEGSGSKRRALRSRLKTENETES